MFKRTIDLSEVLERKSVFLFGPRQTGKSTWLRHQFPNAMYINLLSKQVYDEYLIKKDALISDIEIAKKNLQTNLIIIDEIQKLPQILDEVHNQIELNKSLRFILTGSSARKLKRSGANLLGGRASWKNMFPITFAEMSDDLMTTSQLEKRLLIGGLPSMLTSKVPLDDFNDYIQLYLNEEIRAEGLVRNYEAFHRFLKVAALSNAKQINFTQIGSDAQTPPRTIHDYFQILEDTLIGFMLPPFTESVKRKSMTSAKFYLFDTGVTNAIVNRKQLTFGTTEFGEIFEQYIVTEIKAYCSYTNKNAELFYWRTISKVEVDLVIKIDNKITAIEIKSKSNLGARDLKGLNAFSEEFPDCRKIIITPDSRRGVLNHQIDVYSFNQFLKELWEDKILTH